MDRDLTRRRLLRGAAGLSAGASAALAGCSDPDDGGSGDGDGDDDGGSLYREAGVDPQAGVSDGGSSAG